MVLKYKKVRPGAALPGRATPGSAAADLRAVCGDEGVILTDKKNNIILAELGNDAGIIGAAALVSEEGKFGYII